MKLTVLLGLLLSVTACAQLDIRDRRDAPWDPKPGQTLFDQIPAWDDAPPVQRKHK